MQFRRISNFLDFEESQNSFKWCANIKVFEEMRFTSKLKPQKGKHR
jgi:hypothetical protein